MEILLTTSYLPPVEYFLWFLAGRKIHIEIHENYRKQTFRNRSYIYSPNGKLPLTIPVNRIFGNHTPTKDIEISYHENWQLNHIRAIETAYSSSPFFIYYWDDLKEQLKKKQKNLLLLNQNLLELLLDYLDIQSTIEQTQEFKQETTIHDLRESIHPKKTTGIHFHSYTQVFDIKHGFIANLSVIDLIFNLGTEAKSYLAEVIARNKDYFNLQDTQS